MLVQRSLRLLRRHPAPTRLSRILRARLKHLPLRLRFDLDQLHDWTTAQYVAMHR
jgi:hypothetical protein